MASERYVDHEVLANFAQNKVNVPRDEAKDRRRQVNYLRDRLEAYIADHPDYSLVKLRASGSTAKHTAIRKRGSDADVAAYVRAAPGTDVSTLLEWLRDRCIEVYGKTKVAKDFVISTHAVGITLHGSGLKIDVVPVLYEDEPDDRGYLITRERNEVRKVLTSVTLHVDFIRERRRDAGLGYPELIRLLKAWIRTAKERDQDLRCKSFLLELLVAHLWRGGWNGEPLQVNDYPRAIEQVLAYIVRTGLKEPIVFTDCYKADAVVTSSEPIQVWDPVNPENNVASTYTELDRQRLVKLASDAHEHIVYAARTTVKGDAYDAWRELFGPTFQGL